jgi:glycosyltransferase involved in cell wall biosynthesis
MTDVGLLSLAGDVGGQWQYESALLGAVNGADSDIRLMQIRARGMRSPLQGELRLPVARATRLPVRAQRALMRRVLPELELVHRCDLRLPATDDEVLTIHDTAWRHFDDAPAPSDFSLSSVRRARMVIAPSQFAADEVSTVFPGVAVVVALNGVDPAAANAQALDALQLQSLGLRKDFLLCSGGASRRKNVPALLEAWRQLDDRGRFQLALTGSLPSVHLPGDVVPLGHLPRQLYLRLLAASYAVVVPSVYEGFGLPLPEALSLAKPVLAVNRASLPEVAGGASLLTEPDPLSMRAGLRTLLFDRDARQELSRLGPRRAATFSWVESARRHIDVYRGAT